MLDDGCVVGFVSFLAVGGCDFVYGEGCGVGFSGWWGWVLVFFGLVIGIFFRLLGLPLIGRIHGDGDGWGHEGTEVFG